MPIKNVFETTFAQISSLEEQTKRAAKFLIENKGILIPDPKLIEDIHKNSLGIRTPMSSLYTAIADAGQLDHFLFFDSSKLKDSVPEILTVPGFVIDPTGLNIPLNTNDPTFDTSKVWVNITNYITQRKNKNLPPEIQDMRGLQSAVVKGFLSMSYDDSENIWPSPKMAAFIVKSYTMSVSSGIIKNFQLDYTNEAYFLRVVIALYVAQLLEKNNTNILRPKALFESKFLDNNVKILEMVNVVYELLGEERQLSFNDVITLPKQYIKLKLDRFDLRMFYQNFLKLSSNTSTLDAIAIEYAPYWLHLIIDAISGKSVYLTKLLQMYKLVDEAKRLVNELTMSKLFIQGVTR